MCTSQWGLQRRQLDGQHYFHHMASVQSHTGDCVLVPKLSSSLGRSLQNSHPRGRALTPQFSFLHCKEGTPTAFPGFFHPILQAENTGVFLKVFFLLGTNSHSKKKGFPPYFYIWKWAFWIVLTVGVIWCWSVWGLRSRATCCGPFPKASAVHQVESRPLPPLGLYHLWGEKHGGVAWLSLGFPVVLL